jgi:hypothetical protein
MSNYSVDRHKLAFIIMISIIGIVRDHARLEQTKFILELGS